MNISNTTASGIQFVVSISNSITKSQNSLTSSSSSSGRSGKNQDSVELSPEAMKKFQESQGNESSDFDPISELSAADKKELLSKMKENVADLDSNSEIPTGLKEALSKVKDELSSIDLSTASDDDVSKLLSKVQSSLKDSMPQNIQNGNTPPMGMPPMGMPPMGGGTPPNGNSFQGVDSSSSEGDTLQSILDSLTNDDEDTNDDGVVDYRDSKSINSNSTGTKKETETSVKASQNDFVKEKSITTYQSIMDSYKEWTSSQNSLA